MKIPLIAGNPLRRSNYKVAGNGELERYKNTTHWAISSQDPEMDKVQRLSERSRAY